MTIVERRNLEHLRSLEKQLHQDEIVFLDGILSQWRSLNDVEDARVSAIRGRIARAQRGSI